MCKYIIWINNNFNFEHKLVKYILKNTEKNIFY